MTFIVVSRGKLSKKILSGLGNLLNDINYDSMKDSGQRADTTLCFVEIIPSPVLFILICQGLHLCTPSQFLNLNPLKSSVHLSMTGQSQNHPIQIFYFFSYLESEPVSPKQ